jgi:hypothetical protein
MGAPTSLTHTKWTHVVTAVDERPFRIGRSRLAGCRHTSSPLYVSRMVSRAEGNHVPDKDRFEADERKIRLRQ